MSTSCARRRRCPRPPDELCAVARDVHADPGEIRLGARATEREVKRLSESGELAQYRIVHFATHGALAGQVQGNAEPGLLLTPPGGQARGRRLSHRVRDRGAEARRGLGDPVGLQHGGWRRARRRGAIGPRPRLHLCAGPRAARLALGGELGRTVKLITGAMSRLAADKSMGRAEAMRQSMLALIDKGEPHEAHPAFWAPFVVVGEGGAGRWPSHSRVARATTARSHKTMGERSSSSDRKAST